MPSIAGIGSLGEPRYGMKSHIEGMKNWVTVFHVPRASSGRFNA
jgi:hypothetical protein